MFNKYLTHNILASIISIMMFLIMLWLYFSGEQFMKIVLEKSTSFIPLISFAVSGYSGYGLSRLNVFDKLEELKEKDKVMIDNQVSAFRVAFENILEFSLSCGAIIYILGLIASSDPILNISSVITIDIRVLLGVLFSFSLSVFILLLLSMRPIFNLISELKSKAMALGQIEKKRKALLTKMYEQAEKNPFNEMDFHLKKYRQAVSHDLQNNAK